MALGAGRVSFIAPLTFTSALFSILIARLFAQELERVTWRLAAGALVVFIGVYLVSLSKGGWRRAFLRPHGDAGPLSSEWLRGHARDISELGADRHEG